MATSSTSLVFLLSGAGDGEVRAWHLGSRRCLWASSGASSHRGLVRGASVDPSGQWAITCSNDKSVKMWATQPNHEHVAPQAEQSLAGVQGAATRVNVSRAGKRGTALPPYSAGQALPSTE